MAFQVNLLTQRRDGFWALPTVSEELPETYAPVSTTEDLHRSHAKFGHPSITVSFNALTALSAGTGSLSEWVAPTVLAAIETHRGPQGGYGTPVPRKGQIEINVVPRHTAMAAVTQLHFWRGGHPEALRTHLEPTIEWLLKNQLPRGGWPYDWSMPRAEMGFMSTSSAICALCLHLELGPAGKAMKSRAEAAVAKAYVALAEKSRSGVWDGDGSPPSQQIRDSAFALRLLGIAVGNGILEPLIPRGVSTPATLVAEFSANILEGGWPDRVGQDLVSTVTSISALQVVLAFSNPANLPARAINGVEDAMLADWRTGSLSSRMTSWDWQCLELLAATRIGPMAADTRKSLVRRCEKIRGRWRAGHLHPRDLAEFEMQAKAVLLFALSEGKGFEARPLSARFRSFVGRLWDDIFHGAVKWLLLASFGALLSYLVFGTRFPEFFRNLLAGVGQ